MAAMSTYRICQGELVVPISGASSWLQYLNMNVEFTDENMSKRLQRIRLSISSHWLVMKTLCSRQYHIGFMEIFKYLDVII
jgi:hypothetical protein